jgi:hypothetical protein
MGKHPDDAAAAHGQQIMTFDDNHYRLNSPLTASWVSSFKAVLSSSLLTLEGE